MTTIPHLSFPTNQALLTSPEAMMAYCKTRLSGLDEQIQGFFEKQQKAAKVRQLLNEIQSAFTKGEKDGYWHYDQKKMEAMCAELEAAWKEAGLDPSQLKDIEGSLMGGGAYSDGKLNSEEYDKIGNDFKNLASNVSSAAELDMIQLQSLMSQRQTAIQLTTNIMNGMAETTKGIVANVK